MCPKYLFIKIKSVIRVCLMRAKLKQLGKNTKQFKIAYRVLAQ